MTELKHISADLVRPETLGEKACRPAGSIHHGRLYNFFCWNPGDIRRFFRGKVLNVGFQPIKTICILFNKLPIVEFSFYYHIQPSQRQSTVCPRSNL